jgi:hypothetical protein
MSNETDLFIEAAIEDPIGEAIADAGAIAPDPDMSGLVEALTRDTRRPLREILDDLAKPIPKRLLKTKSLGGSEITFIPWYRAQKILDHYTEGRWEYRIVDKQLTESSCWVTVEITIFASDAVITRQGAGIERMDVSGYGDPSSNAISMAFRRCCARFGIGLSLYEGG